MAKRRWTSGDLVQKCENWCDGLSNDWHWKLPEIENGGHRRPVQLLAREEASEARWKS